MRDRTDAYRPWAVGATQASAGGLAPGITSYGVVDWPDNVACVVG